jgi:hypothetical protein
VLTVSWLLTAICCCIGYLRASHWLLTLSSAAAATTSSAAAACVLHLGACIILGLDPYAVEATMREQPLWPASLVLSEAKRMREDRDLHVL